MRILYDWYEIINKNNNLEIYFILFFQITISVGPENIYTLRMVNHENHTVEYDSVKNQPQKASKPCCIEPVNTDRTSIDKLIKVLTIFVTDIDVKFEIIDLLRKKVTRSE